MNLKYLKHSRSGFTLVEMVLAMTIIGIMSVMTLSIYFNISETSRRLQISRELSETARQITEKISQEVRENGIFLGKNHSNPIWQEEFLAQYTADGGNILNINAINEDGTPGKKSFLYGQKMNNAINKCENPTDTNSRCGLYLWENGEFYNLVDAFREDEDKKRVRITDLKFFVTGGDFDANKVTLKMTLELAPRIGVPESLIRATKMEIQTTFSERPYKIK